MICSFKKSLLPFKMIVYLYFQLAQEFSSVLVTLSLRDLLSSKNFEETVKLIVYSDALSFE